LVVVVYSQRVRERKGSEGWEWDRDGRDERQTGRERMGRTFWSYKHLMPTQKCLRSRDPAHATFLQILSGHAWTDPGNNV